MIFFMLPKTKNYAFKIIAGILVNWHFFRWFLLANIENYICRNIFVKSVNLRRFRGLVLARCFWSKFPFGVEFYFAMFFWTVENWIRVPSNWINSKIIRLWHFVLNISDNNSPDISFGSTARMKKSTFHGISVKGSNITFKKGK